MAPEQLKALSHVLRCDAEELVGRAGTRVRHDGGEVRDCVRHGDLETPRAHLGLSVRRIAPLALRKAGHHRLDWLNLLLPYCPATLERLVDTCPNCGMRLGWGRSLGIGVCEGCGRIVPPSPEGPLGSEHREGYRGFAGLTSPLPDARARAVAALPGQLRHAPPGELVRLAHRAGVLRLGRPIDRSRETSLPKLDAPDLAEVVATGYATLLDWPYGVRAWAADQASRLSADSAKYLELRRGLRRLGDRIASADGAGTLAEAAFPDLGGTIGRDFAGDERIYLTHQVQLVLGVSHAKIAALRDGSVLPFARSPSGRPIRGRFDAERVDDAAAAVRSALASSTCQATFGLSIYGIEQLVCVGLLGRATHPVVLALHDDLRIEAPSADRLAARLDGLAVSDAPPPTTVKLRLAAMRIGGRLKPWGAIYLAMIGGKLRFWRSAAGVSVDDLLVDPEDLSSFDELTFDRKQHADVPFATDMHTIDAAEVLNLTPVGVERLRHQGVLSVDTKGKRRSTSAGEVIALAEEWVSNAELARRSGRGIRGIRHCLTAGGVASKGGLWSRRSSTVTLAIS